MSTATARRHEEPTTTSATTGSLGAVAPVSAATLTRARRDDPLPLSSNLTIQISEAAASTTAQSAEGGSMTAVRELSREMAGSVPADEASSLYAERRDLLARVLAGAATKAERNRLALVRWHLERIEDARHGEGLDKLEALGRLYAKMADRVRDVVGELERVKAR